MTRFRHSALSIVGVMLLLLALAPVSPEPDADKTHPPVRGCYYTNWSLFRQGRAQFRPNEHYVPGLCTHIFFAYAIFGDDFLVRHNTPTDLTTARSRGMYGYINGLKATDPQLKTLISIGGNRRTEDFSAMASTKTNRKTFIDSAIAFVRLHGFDGIDFNWEFPSTPLDKQNFNNLLEESRIAVEAEALISGKRRLLLTAAVSANEETVADAYDIPIMARHLDLAMVMAYLFHGSWEPNTTGHPSALFPGVFDTEDEGKLNVICERIEAGATRYWDDEKRVPWLVMDDQWWGYNDEQSVTDKIAFIKRERLAGFFVWSIDNDDFNGGCSNGDQTPYPLIRAMNRALLPETTTSTTTSTTTTTAAPAVIAITTATSTTTLSAPLPSQPLGVVCGEPAVEARGNVRVLGGRLAVPGSWPWHAALLVQGVYRCGAVLITQRVALTAAHCVNKFLSPGLFTVVLGAHNWNASSSEADHYELERFVVHPDYNKPNVHSNDIALLFRKKSVRLRDVVNTVCVARQPPPPGSFGVATGWGMISLEKNATNTLRQVELPLVPAEQCNQAELYNGAVDTQSQFCAGRPGRDSCKGDSGGPFVTVGHQRGWTLSGIVSWGWYCSFHKYPGVYTSVSHAFHWIESEVIAMNYTNIGDKILCDCD